MNEAIQTTLGEVCDFIGGSQPAKKYFSDHEQPGYIRLIQIRDYKTDSYLTYIPKDSTRKFCDKKDIMIGRYGPPIFQILRGIEGAYNVALMKAKPKGDIFNDYLYYFLRQEHLFEYINALSPRTGGQTGVDVTMLKEFPVQLPSIDNQKAIAKVLSDLDAKIELNNKINAELEAMAKLIYDYWFVQFEFPVINDDGTLSAAEGYKSSGGKMFYNEALKRELPEGWEVKKLKKTVKTDLGGTPSTKNEEYWGGDFPWLNSGEIANFPIVDSELRVTEAGINNSAATLMPRKSVVLSITRHLRPSILAVDACANQSVVGLFESDQLKAEYLYPYLVNEIPRLMSLRTGAQQPHINKGIVDDSWIITPPVDLLKHYYDKVESMYDSIINNSFQNQELTALRDWLLPMLMNGQVKVA